MKLNAPSSGRTPVRMISKRYFPVGNSNSGKHASRRMPGNSRTELDALPFSRRADQSVRHTHDVQAICDTPPLHFDWRIRVWIKPVYKFRERIGARRNASFFGRSETGLMKRRIGHAVIAAPGIHSGPVQTGGEV